ncbi:virulence protein [Mediterraneibacter faecis]|uniref:virulence protein n=1 Tax=Mediterraneibacter faecis TaxID=592978 RepID=UPI003CEEAD28
METRYNVTGEKRKEMVEVISGVVGMRAVYMRMPTCAYAISNITVSRDGTLAWDERTDSRTIEKVKEALAAAGFTAEETEETAQEAGTEEETAEPENHAEEPETAPQGADLGLTVAMPRESFTDAALENLRRLVDAKGSLIKKALAVDSLPIETDGEKVSFPWFAEGQDSESVKAYTHFITALCDMARNQKRITAKEKPADNEKYAFRCFLLRLGFIGAEYKGERKILLKNLSGSSAFKNGEPKSETLRPEPVNPAMRVDAGEHPELTEELLDEVLIQQVNAGMGGAADGISE